uniref:Uncharacterized protein n=1 Tax=Lactuca sativa TaxID=4236 RepID=A0A9R1UL46_LACSA|nr:hypothetical protein LSAT_V11C800433480 [Lactuca sativa]
MPENYRQKKFFLHFTCVVCGLIDLGNREASKYEESSYLRILLDSRDASRYLFPLPLGNLKWLQLAMQMLVLGLNLATGQAPLNKPCNIPLHTGPPILSLLVQIHLSGPRMDQETRFVRLLH